MIVLQAWAGMPWWITCSGLMATNGITREEVEQELTRLADWPAFADSGRSDTSGITTDLPAKDPFLGILPEVDSRAIVFDVIVQQALAGAPWREICAGPMDVNHIAPEEIEAEVRKRGGDAGLAGAPVPRRPYPTLGGKDIALPLPPSDDTETLDSDESGSES